MTDAVALAREFWARMGTNDWGHAAALFAPGGEIAWPQSGEVIGSAEDFAALNAAYPAHGLWTFEIVRVIGAGDHAVTETRVSDGTVTALAVSIFTCAGDRITAITEYWPDPFAAPQWRRQWVTLRPR